jgi:tetratricopeptide (TPR) repeat protein
MIARAFKPSAAKSKAFLEGGKLTDTKKLETRAKMLLNKKNYGEALNVFDEIIRHQPKHEYAWKKKGDTLALIGRYHDAIDCYNTLISLGLALDTAWYRKGEVYRKIKKHDSAVACYNKAIELRPNFKSAHRRKRECEALLRRTKSEESGEERRKKLDAIVTRELQAYDEDKLKLKLGDKIEELGAEYLPREEALRQQLQSEVQKRVAKLKSELAFMSTRYEREKKDNLEYERSRIRGEFRELETEKERLRDELAKKELELRAAFEREKAKLQAELKAQLSKNKEKLKELMAKLESEAARKDSELRRKLEEERKKLEEEMREKEEAIKSESARREKLDTMMHELLLDAERRSKKLIKKLGAEWKAKYELEFKSKLAEELKRYKELKTTYEQQIAE